MVSQDTTPNPSLHHFFISSDPSNTQAHFENQGLNPYGSILGMFPRSMSLEPEMGQANRHVMDLFGGGNRHGGELSLSLATEGLVPPLPYEDEACCSQGMGYIGAGECSYMGCGVTTLGPSAFASYSRYLRPAQALLEEAANVGGRAVEVADLRRVFLSGSNGATSCELKAELLSLTGASSSTDRHELQIKISRLIALLEQVECRYEDYCNQMRELVSSFEVIAGEGAAKTYTALALQAMCRHFRTLREAILGQIKVVRKRLCPDPSKIRTGLSQLSLFDREARQSRLSLQQLGLMQHCQRQAWRPIRGLPETSVAILRAWLFEHFLHPYPNDSEKLILASQTGLSKNQVSNWFINARVRLWKPMIEEMYKEEFGESSSPGDSDALFSTNCSSSREPLPHQTPDDDQ